MFFLGNEYYDSALIDHNQSIYLLLYTLTFLLHLFLSFLFFRIRRFKKGFPFVFKRYTIVVSLVFAGIVLIFVTWVNMITKLEDDYLESRSFLFVYLIGVLIAGIGIYILIRRLIKASQKKRVQQQTEEYYKSLLRESEEKHAQKDELIKFMSSKIHNFTDRIKAMERAAEEYGDNVLLKDIQSLNKDWQDGLSGYRSLKPLPSTKISTIDNLFLHYAKQFADDNINFSLIVNGSIKYMIDNIIDTGSLETLIVNHLNDAQIAINSSENSFRSIMAVIGLNENHYEFTVFDGGIPFEADTLSRLGTERVTTHAETGGSGIGFETTFEIIRKYNASLIINEKEPSTAYHSKSIFIRFDNMNQYIIETYRPLDIVPSDRYIVKSL